MSNENETNTPDQSPEEKPAKKEPKKVPPKKASASVEETGAAPAAEKPAAPPPPAPPEPGPYAVLLSKNGFSPSVHEKDAGGIETVVIAPSELLAVCRFLKENAESQFDLLVSIAGVDWKDRLEAVYHLYSTKTFGTLVLKATAENEKLPSVISVWYGADWHERETYDLYGIQFEGHPNLKRILLPSDWVGFPMRKDYKMEDPRLVWNER